MHRIVDADRARLVTNSWNGLGEADPRSRTLAIAWRRCVNRSPVTFSR